MFRGLFLYLNDECYIYLYLFILADEYGKVFAYRTNGAQFEKDNIHVYDRSETKSAPIKANPG